MQQFCSTQLSAFLGPAIGLRAMLQLSACAPSAPDTQCIRVSSPLVPGALPSLQEQRQAALLYQQQLEDQQGQARMSASKVTRLAISDLETLKQQLEQQKHQAAVVGQHLTHRHGSRAALRHRLPGMWDLSDSDAGCGSQEPPAHQHVQPVVSYIHNYLHI